MGLTDTLTPQTRAFTGPALLRPALMLVLAVVVASCGAAGAATHDASGQPDASLSIVTTTNIVAASVEPLVGDDVEVTSLMGAGVDPHDYQPVASDLTKLRDADLALAVGLDLEANLLPVLDNLTDTEVVRIGEAVPAEKLLPADEEMYDPHVWFDVDLWSYAVGAAADAVVDIAPQMESQVTEATAQFLQELDDLHVELDQTYASIAPQQRVLVTSHDAFRYLGRAYEIEVEGIQGISTASEATTDDVQRAVDLVVDREIPAIFVESSVNPAALDAVIAAAGRSGVEVSSGGALFSDAAGEPGTAEGTYEGMLRANATTITDALTR